MLANDFDWNFQFLTGNPPFPWQRALFEDFVRGDFRDCDIPTGLGKTSVIAIWLLALATRATQRDLAEFPRRLVYVVNRRTVVDQATDEARHVRAALRGEALASVRAALGSLAVWPSTEPIAISTLRGEFADNAEWRQDPARPAIIVGTVDMVGSRLLFSGYACGFKTRPLHAAFLAQDSLVVHDEAHLEPAFQALLVAIRDEQERCRDFRRVRVIALTATSRNQAGAVGNAFGLTHADYEHDVVAKRLNARKGIVFVPVQDPKSVADEVVRLALEHRESGGRILIFLRLLEDVDKVAARIRASAPGRVQLLTGTLRGRERDRLATEDEIFGRFLVKPPRDVVLTPGTVFLVCTSAGEIGVDMSADHLVCDLTPFDSMAQRLGRVNRLGDGDARIDVVHSEAEAKSRYEEQCTRALALLRRLPARDDGRYDASPAALANLPAAERRAAFTPQPAVPPTSSILFDAWALTSIRDPLPGRPPVPDWLHGVTGEPPETHVAWRQEVAEIDRAVLDQINPEDLLEDYPLKPHELLRDRTSRVIEQLEKIAERAPDIRAWVVRPGGTVQADLLSKLIAKDRYNKPPVGLFADCTVLLPPAAGGLSKEGLLAGDEPSDEARAGEYDVADQWLDEDGRPRRVREQGDHKPGQHPGMRLVRVIDLRRENSHVTEDLTENAEPLKWYWYVRPRSADDDGSRSAVVSQFLEAHHNAAERRAVALVSKLGLVDPEATAVVLASRRHDLGKAREVWQQSVNNANYPQVVLAKSDEQMSIGGLKRYRHEFGSLIDTIDAVELGGVRREVADLALHLIAAHHGRARPHFPPEEAFDRERRDTAVEEIAKQVPLRFSRLQRKYGRWGLAYLESLVRAADVMASQDSDSPQTMTPDDTADVRKRVQS